MVAASFAFDYSILAQKKGRSGIAEGEDWAVNDINMQYNRN
jgi:hypothetical protein